MGTSTHLERRDISSVGQRNRTQFEASVHLLHDLGFSPRATEYFKRRARRTRQLPHKLLVEFVEEALLQLAVAETTSRLSGGV